MLILASRVFYQIVKFIEYLGRHKKRIYKVINSGLDLNPSLVGIPAKDSEGCLLWLCLPKNNEG